jgi:hypothetical protein
MPLPVRRLAAPLAVGLLTAAIWAVLTPGAAVAAPRYRVTFLGGTPSGLLGCSAHPDVARLRVPAESTVTVVNQLGQRAELVVNSVDYGPVPAGQQVGVVVHHGPVQLMLVPGCQLTGRTEPVTIEVTGVPAGSPAPGSTIPAATVPSARSSGPGAVQGSGTLADPQPAAPTGLGVGSADRVPRTPHFSGLLLLVAATLVVGVSIMAIRGKTGDRVPIMRSAGHAAPRHARAADKFR